MLHGITVQHLVHLIYKLAFLLNQARILQNADMSSDKTSQVVKYLLLFLLDTSLLQPVWTNHSAYFHKIGFVKLSDWLNDVYLALNTNSVHNPRLDQLDSHVASLIAVPLRRLSSSPES